MIINKSFRFLFTDKNRYIIVYGGSGSGKSVSLAQYIFLDLLKDTTINWLVLRKYSTTLLNSTFAELKSVILQEKAQSHFKINETIKRFQCVTGNFCMMSGLDDPEKIKSIQGITKIWIEEATEFTEADIKQLMLRLRGLGEKKQFYFTFNPIDANHFIKQYFFDVPRDDTTIKHTTYRDNKFLDAEYIQELENLERTDYYFYTVYCLGEWGVISKAKVFHNLKIWDYEWKDENGIIFDGVKWGMDFGFIHASTLIGTAVKENQLYLLPELYHKGLTNTEWIKEVDKYEIYDRNKYIIADSAEPARIADFRNASYKIASTKKGKGSLKDGIDYLCSFEVINIHKDLCPNAAIEFQNFKRRELKDGTITEEFVERNDDCIAGARYSREDEIRRKKRVMKKPAYNKRKILGW